MKDEAELEQYEQYEEKSDELWEGLLTAYCAGFAKAAETFDDRDIDVENLKGNDLVTESHYYFWDGRELPLQFWLEQQFGVGLAPSEVDNDGE